MSKMKNWMADIEEFCNGYFVSWDGENLVDDFTVEEISEDAKNYFLSTEAGKYAKRYLTTKMGEF